MCRRHLLRIRQWHEPCSEGASRLNDHIFGLGVRRSSRCWQNGGKGAIVCTIALRVYSAVVEIPASFLMDQDRYGLQQRIKIKHHDVRKRIARFFHLWQPSVPVVCAIS